MGQLLGTQIPHPSATAGSIGALMIAMIRPSFRTLAMAQSSGTHDAKAAKRTAPIRAVRLPAITPAADREQVSAKSATSQSMNVHAVPAAERHFVGPLGRRAGWSVPSARPRDKEGRELSLSAFRLSRRRRSRLLSAPCPTVKFLANSRLGFYGSEGASTNVTTGLNLPYSGRR
jgi:hypothetical protein